MGEYSIPAISESLLWMFSLFFWKRKIWKKMKFNALKAARPEVADTEILWNSLLKKKRLPKISN
jgi:hypothetical protein